MVSNGSSGLHARRVQHRRSVSSRFRSRPQDRTVGPFTNALSIPLAMDKVISTNPCVPRPWIPSSTRPYQQSETHLLSFNPSCVGTPFPLYICDDQSMLSAAFNAAQNTSAAPKEVSSTKEDTSLHASVLCRVTRYESGETSAGGGRSVSHVHIHSHGD